MEFVERASGSTRATLERETGDMSDDKILRRLAKSLGSVGRVEELGSDTPASALADLIVFDPEAGSNRKLLVKRLVAQTSRGKSLPLVEFRLGVARVGVAPESVRFANDANAKAVIGSICVVDDGSPTGWLQVQWALVGDDIEPATVEVVARTLFDLSRDTSVALDDLLARHPELHGG